jgi:hypothetical protein
VLPAAAVTVMKVGNVRVCVLGRAVLVPVRVPHPGREVVMRVTVMPVVVAVAVDVAERLVGVMV